MTRMLYISNFCKASKKKRLFFIIVFFFVISLLIGWRFYITPIAFTETFITDLKNSNKSYPEPSLGFLTAGDSIEQTIEIKEKTDGLAVMFGNYARKNDSRLWVTAKDAASGEIYFDKTFPVSEIADNAFHTFVFDKSAEVRNIPWVMEFTAVSLDADKDNAVTIYINSRDLYKKGELTVRGEKLGGDIIFTTFQRGKPVFVSYIYIFISVILLVSFIFIYWGLIFRNWRLYWAMLPAIISLGFVSSTVNFPYLIPDEREHANAAYEYSNLALLKGPEQWRTGDLERKGERFSPYKESYRMIWDRFHLFNEESGWSSDSNKKYSGLNPVGYIFSGFTMAIAKVFNLGYFPMIYLARMANLLFFAVCVWFAVKIIPFGKSAIAISAILPNVLYQSASLSYDPVVFGLSFVLTAYTLRAATQERSVSIREIVFICLVGAFLGASKIIYCIIAFLCFLIPAAKYGSRKRWFFISSGIVFAAVVGSLAFNGSFITGVISHNQPNHIAWSGGETYTLSWALSHPHLVFKIFINTATTFSSFLVENTITYLESGINPFLLYVYIGLLLLASIKSDAGENPLSKNMKFVLASVTILGVLAASMSMMIYWTLFSNSFINGLQGRYFIPFLPLVLLLFRTDRLVYRGGEFEKGLFLTAYVVSAMAFVSGYISIISE